MASSGSQHVNASHSAFTDVSGIQNTVNTHISNSKDPSKPDAVKAPPHFPMPSHNELFAGRDAYLEKLLQYFCPRDTCDPSRYCLVHGIGGAGKTYICLRLIEQISKRFWRVFWIDATTDETIESSLRAIAADPDAQAAGVEHSFTSVLQWLSDVKHDWLMVFDNIIDSGVAKYLPRGNRGNILFTSRDPNLPCLDSAVKHIEVNSMEEDAISLLLRSSGIDVSSTQARQAAGPIVNELFCIPLAVGQAGAAIASGLYGMDDYLEAYRHHCQSLLSNPSFEGASSYGRAVYGTWDLSFMAILRKGGVEAKSANFIIRTFAFFHHENISEEIIKRAAESSDMRLEKFPPQLLQLHQSGKWDPIFFRKGIQILQSFSLLKSTAASNVYSMHPLVHCWSRDRMSSEDQQMSSYLAFTLLSSSIEVRYMAEDHRYRRSLIPHIKAVIAGCVPSDDIKGYSRFSLALNEAGHWKEAEKLDVHVMKSSLKMLGKDHPDTLSSMESLALSYSSLGKWKEAEKLGVQVMESSLRVLGEDHPHTLAIMADLASTYGNQGRWKEAEKLEVQVMESRLRLFNKEDYRVITSKGNLAVTYRAQGRLKEAEELELQVTESRKRVLGEEHPDTLMSLANLAVLYFDQGRWKEAEKLAVQVLECRNRVLGEKHPDTLVGMAILALTYGSQGRWKEAEELEVQATELSMIVVGEEHPNTLLIMGNLASTYWAQGRREEAKKLDAQVVELRKKVLGDDHLDTLGSMEVFASRYQN